MRPTLEFGPPDTEQNLPPGAEPEPDAAWEPDLVDPEPGLPAARRVPPPPPGYFAQEDETLR